MTRTVVRNVFVVVNVRVTVFVLQIHGVALSVTVTISGTGAGRTQGCITVIVVGKHGFEGLIGIRDG